MRLRFDKIVAIESLLNQIQVMRDFGFNSVAIVETTERGSTRNEYEGLFGFEDLGVLSLLDASRVVQKKLSVNDILKITQSWESDNLYKITVDMRQGTLTILYTIPSVVVAIA